MPYKVIYSKYFLRDFKKLDKPIQKMIGRYIVRNIENTIDPRVKGKILSGNQGELLRYRISDYRLIVKIDDKKLILLALKIGHRRSIYKD